MKTISENSAFRRVWDSVILALIFVSCAIIPFQVVFNNGFSGNNLFLFYLINLFFIIDIVLNFRTSFRYQGKEIFDSKRNSVNYLRSNFIIDLVANFPFELLILPYTMLSGRGASIITLLQVLRLLRISRFFIILRRWSRTGWVNPSYLRIAKFLGIMAILIHCLACGWFQIAANDGFPDNSWVARNSLKDASINSQYIRSLYWTITTMTTIGYGDITPGRNLEYLFAMIVMLVGASMYAFIIGNVASLMSHLDSGKVNHWNRMETVTGYLRSRQVPNSLVTRVRDYYEYLWERYRGLPDYTLVNDLPESLRLELLLSLTHDLLENVPLFKYCKPALRDALLIALKPYTYDPGSHVVIEGDAGKGIYFISQGTVDVLKEGHLRIEVLQNGDYFGHMTILFKEKRTASVVATSYCEMFVLSEEAYNQVLKNYPELRNAMKKMSSEASEKQAALMREGVVL